MDNTQLLQSVLVTFIPLAALVVGLVAIVKPFVTERLAPVVAILFGVLIAFVASFIVSVSWPVIVLGGIALGLAASGLYSGSKATFQG